eukprot:6216370-Pyramimonas_sp.AAC.1
MAIAQTFARSWQQQRKGGSQSSPKCDASSIMLWASRAPSEHPRSTPPKNNPAPASVTRIVTCAGLALVTCGKRHHQSAHATIVVYGTLCYSHEVALCAPTIKPGQPACYSDGHRVGNIP